MSVSPVSGSNAALQSLTPVQNRVKFGHGGNDGDADDGGSARGQAPAPGGFMVSLLQSLQQVLSAQAPAAAPSAATTGLDATAAAGATTVAATTAKDLGNFLHTLFQAMRASGNPANAAASTTATDATGTTAATTATTATTAIDPAAVAAGNTNAGGAAAVDGDGDHDGSSGASAKSHHRHGLGAYRNNLVSGLQAVLQQLKSGGADSSGSSTAGSTGLSGLTSAFQTLMQDLSGAQAGGAAAAGGATSSAALQSFLTDLIGSLQSSGNTSPAATGNIVSTTA